MSILDEYFGIFAEGEKDVLYRRMAQDALRKTVAALKTPKAKAAMETMGNEYGNFVEFDMVELLEEPEFSGLLLSFVFDEEAVGKRNGGFKPKPQPTIELNFDRQVPADGPTLAKMLEMKRDVFMHEFIHYLDFKRMGPRGSDVVTKTSATAKHGTGDSDRQKYVSSPMEYNAFFQQGIGNIENYLNSLPPESRSRVAQKMLGGSPNEFWKRITDSLKGQPWFNSLFVKHLDDKMLDKFKKRSAQAYLEIMRGLRSAEKWRGGPEKDKATRIAKLKAGQARATAKKAERG